MSHMARKAHQCRAKLCSLNPREREANFFCPKGQIFLA